MEKTDKINPYLIGGGVLVALVAGFFVSRGFSGERTDAPTMGEPPAAVGATAERMLPKDVRFKVPVSDMQPSRGPKDALVTMVEWCDLRGSVCRDADVVLKELMKEYEGRLRWVYRSVPDSSRPDEAKLIHQFSRAVYEDGKNSMKFWQVRDQLLALPDSKTIGEAELRPIAKSVGVDFDALAPKIRDTQFMTAPGLDSGFAVRFGVRSIPAIFINGRPVQGITSPSELKQALKTLIDAELPAAERALAQGVTKDALYDKLVEGGLWSLDDNPATRQASAAAKPFIPGTSAGQPAGKP